ncbi:hypothetical protein [uncultured Novosphingobium sp.]|uniref:hypothetical protein n=1 Tax=uncultured Novosphingobium sp. TaxID=292277 RepID=UPI002589B1BF|nr:hypothetical protein [uncultured Novosphingobium sp.]
MANVTWNPSDKHANITLSGDLFTATHSVSGQYNGVRGTVGYSTGTYYFEALVPEGNEGAAGVAATSHNLTDPLGFYGGSSGAGLFHDGTLFVGGTSYSANQIVGNTSVGFLVNVATKRLWVRSAAGAWVLGGDPTSSGPGIDLSGISGALYPMFVAYYPTDSSMIRAESTNINMALPAGASLWGDGAVVTPPATPAKVYGSVYWH